MKKKEQRGEEIQSERSTAATSSLLILALQIQTKTHRQTYIKTKRYKEKRHKDRET